MVVKVVIHNVILPAMTPAKVMTDNAKVLMGVTFVTLNVILPVTQDVRVMLGLVSPAMIVSLVMTVAMAVIPAMEIVIVIAIQSMAVVPYVKAVVLPVTLAIHRPVIDVIRLVRPQIVAVVILLVIVV